MIDILKLADRFQQIENQQMPLLARRLAEEPRLREAILFVQAMSLQPGGLPAFAARLVARYPGQFQTAEMAKLGQPKGGSYGLRQCLQLWREMRQIQALRSYGQFNDWAAANLDPYAAPESIESGAHYDKAAIQRGLVEFNFEYLANCCREAAQSDLPAWLANWMGNNWMGSNCLENGFGSPWYCPRLPEIVLDFMEQWAAQTEASIASTEISRRAFRELNFAESQKVPVPIVGESRFGKTTAIRVWCQARPGRRRLVTVPESNTERDFIQAHADALGIGFNTQTTTARLRELVQHVLAQTGIFIAYDEAHFLVPANYTRTTPPRRLNWVRAHVMDREPGREVGCAFFATPQSYRQTLDSYVRVTGWNREQWFGRMAPVVILPAELNRKDLMAVARNQFADIDPDLMELIAARAMRSEGYLKNLELVAKRARFLASERAGRGSAPNDADVEQALADMLPAQDQARNPAPSRTAAARPTLRGVPADRPQPVAKRPLPSLRDGSAGSKNYSENFLPTGREIQVSELPSGELVEA